MTNKKHLIIIALIGVVALCVQCAKTFERNPEDDTQLSKSTTAKKDGALIAEGQHIFRFDTFGDEDFWSGLLHLDKAILEKSPLFKFWTSEIFELFVLDGQHYRLPAVQPN